MKRHQTLSLLWGQYMYNSMWMIFYGSSIIRSLSNALNKLNHDEHHSSILKWWDSNSGSQTVQILSPRKYYFIYSYSKDVSSMLNVLLLLNISLIRFNTTVSQQ